jgi:hypothetical protein
MDKNYEGHPIWSGLHLNRDMSATYSCDMLKTYLGFRLRLLPSLYLRAASSGQPSQTFRLA